MSESVEKTSDELTEMVNGLVETQTVIGSIMEKLISSDAEHTAINKQILETIETMQKTVVNLIDRVTTLETTASLGKRLGH